VPSSNHAGDLLGLFPSLKLASPELRGVDHAELGNTWKHHVLLQSESTDICVFELSFRNAPGACGPVVRR
jgi:hypothetical protein